MALINKPATSNEPKPSSAPAPKEGENTADKMYLGDKKARRRFTWRPSSGGPEYTKDAVFDFSKCTEEQIILLALDSATIKIQAHLRNAANGAKDLKVDPALYNTVDVLNDVVLASTRADPVASAIAMARKAGAPEAAIKALAESLANAKRK